MANVDAVISVDIPVTARIRFSKVNLANVNNTLDLVFCIYRDAFRFIDLCDGTGKAAVGFTVVVRTIVSYDK